jgi:1-deoxy-D-xylulose-5-phosphate reductoisomerase
MPRNVAILGSTGSIGTNSLDVISRMGGMFRVTALSADSSIGALSAQARRFRPRTVCIGDARLARDLGKAVPPRTAVSCGPSGLIDIVTRPDVDIVMFAIGGNACLVPLVEAIKARKIVALANKEAMVSAGPILTGLARSNGVKILPIDSEHSAIFQCIDGSPSPASRIYLTGSGGPLLRVRAGRFDRLRPEFILRHPRWKMGKKISVDSATMMNKGLEILEAQALFGIDEARIEVVVHPEAVIHSMVEFADGAVMAQMAVPDMRIPIQYALTYPERLPSPAGRIDLARTGKLTFMKPDGARFPCLGLARSAARSGGTAPAVLSASDEEAVRSYLNGRIKFTRIPQVIEKVLARHRVLGGRLSVGAVLEADAWAREEARSICCR